jgi:serine/threonine protein kinase
LEEEVRSPWLEEEVEPSRLEEEARAMLKRRTRHTGEEPPCWGGSSKPHRRWSSWPPAPPAPGRSHRIGQGARGRAGDGAPGCHLHHCAADLLRSQIATPSCSFEDDDTVHLVLDLCAGGDLLSLISARGGPLPEPKAADLAAQLWARRGRGRMAGARRGTEGGRLKQEGGGGGRLGVATRGGGARVG